MIDWAVHCMESAHLHSKISPRAARVYLGGRIGEC